MTITTALLYYLAFINIVTFCLYGIDKYKAKRNKWRVSEQSLILLAVVGGSIGTLFAMKLFHHKTLHKKFYIGVPMVLLLQIAVVAYIIQYHC